MSAGRAVEGVPSSIAGHVPNGGGGGKIDGSRGTSYTPRAPSLKSIGLSVWKLFGGKFWRSETVWVILMCAGWAGAAVGILRVVLEISRYPI